MSPTHLYVPIPPPPVEKPPINLVDSANEPNDTTGGRWTGGFAYLPESRNKGVARDVCDFTTVDYPALSAPSGLAGTPSATGGTLAAGVHPYQVTSTNGNGETTPCTTVNVTTTGATGSVTLTWTADPDATGYKVYGKVAGITGSVGLIATVTVPTYLDTGAASVGAAPPGSNTTAGGGNYTQPGIVQYIPWLSVAEDACSSFGFDEHDYIGRAQRLLALDTINSLEFELWTGTLAQAKGYPNDYLANAATCVDVTPIPSTPPSITRGIQVLEDYNASVGAGGRAMIHLMPQAAPSLLNAQRSGNLLLSELDNILVPGSGYPGTGPVGNTYQTPGTGYTWIYITDVVNVRRDDPVVIPDNFAEAIDFGQGDQPNQIVFRAEQLVAADFAGLVHAGCRVQLAS